jgi:tetratricopeptide (TPR) repeat protein
LLFATPQLAQADQAKPDYAAAKKHYAEAEKAAQEKDWARAAKEYGVAYEITRDPVLFFKLGNAYQLSGDCTRAVEYYERYIAEANPSDEYRADTQTRIANCNTSLAGATTEPAEPDDPAPPEETTPTPATTTTPGLEEASAEDSAEVNVGTDSEQVGQPTFLDDEPTWQETAAWTSVGVSFALLSVSAILGLSADSREEDIDNLFRYRDSEGNPAEYTETVRKRHESLIEEGEDLNTMSMVALGLAGVSTVSAVVFFVLDSSASNESEGLSSIRPTLSEDSVGVSAGWTF